MRVVVLFVCTANVCRSPMAAALFRVAAIAAAPADSSSAASHPGAEGATTGGATTGGAGTAGAGSRRIDALLDPAVFIVSDFTAGDLDGTLTVASAGLLESGRPVVPEVVRVMTPYGIDLAGHGATQLTTAAVEEADLILGMERRHGREAILLVPGAWSRTFTLKDLVRRGEKTGARLAGQPLEAWLDLLGEGRERTDLIGRAPEDEVADPLGGSLADFRATAAELADLTQRLTRLLWTEAVDVPIPPS
jgi:protein-tyrosine-phosphatase